MVRISKDGQYVPPVTRSQSRLAGVQNRKRVTISQSRPAGVQIRKPVTRSQSHPAGVQNRKRVTKSQSHPAGVQNRKRVTRSQSHPAGVQNRKRVTKSQSHPAGVQNQKQPKSLPPNAAPPSSMDQYSLSTRSSLRIFPASQPPKRKADSVEKDVQRSAKKPAKETNPRSRSPIPQPIRLQEILQSNFTRIRLRSHDNKNVSPPRPVSGNVAGVPPVVSTAAAAASAASTSAAASASAAASVSVPASTTNFWTNRGVLTLQPASTPAQLLNNPFSFGSASSSPFPNQVPKISPMTVQNCPQSFSYPSNVNWVLQPFYPLQRSFSSLMVTTPVNTTHGAMNLTICGHVRELSTENSPEPTIPAFTIDRQSEEAVQPPIIPARQLVDVQPPIIPTPQSEDVQPPIIPTPQSADVQPPIIPPRQLKDVQPPIIPTPQSEAVQPPIIPARQSEDVQPPIIPARQSEDVQPPIIPTSQSEVVQPPIIPTPQLEVVQPPMIPARESNDVQPPIIPERQSEDVGPSSTSLSTSIRTRSSIGIQTEVFEEDKAISGSLNSVPSEDSMEVDGAMAPTEQSTPESSSSTSGTIHTDNEQPMFQMNLTDIIYWMLPLP